MRQETSSEVVFRRLRLLFIITGVLMYFNYTFHSSKAQKNYNTVRNDDIEFVSHSNSNDPNQFDILRHTCFKGKHIAKVNDKTGTHETCFAACIAHSGENPDQKCYGWSILQNFANLRVWKNKKGSSTCFLYGKPSTNVRVHKLQCDSGLIWENAYILTDFVQDEFDDSDFYLTEEEIEEYYYNQRHNYYDYYTETSESSSNNSESSSVVSYTQNLDLNSINCAEEVLERPLRIYILCSQASGCTLLSYLLSQNERSVSILDIGVRQQFPSQNYFKNAHFDFPDTQRIVVKQVLRGISNKSEFSIENLVLEVSEKFSQDFTILFLRNPIDLFLTLVNHIGKGTKNEPKDLDFIDCNKKYFDNYDFGLRCGTPLSKLRSLNLAFLKAKKLKINQIIQYETLCLHKGRQEITEKLNKNGICSSESEWNRPKKSIVEILEKSLHFFPSSKEDGVKEDKLFWGAGDLHNTFHESDSWLPKTEEEVWSLCPKKENLKEFREKLLKTAAQPYNSYTLEEITQLVTEAAPDLIKYYNLEVEP